MAMDDKGFLAVLSRYHSLTELVEQLYVPAILESYQRLLQQSDLSSLSEPKIRNRLAQDFENRNCLLKELLDNGILHIVYENTRVNEMNDDTFRTDIEFLLSCYGKFVIECKKQDSYSVNYMNEGIYRFRDEKYKANEAGMLAFIVGGNVSKISSKTKTKVEEDSSFVDPSHSSLLCALHPHSFHSSHKRVSASSLPILIHHVFLDFTSSSLTLSVMDSEA